MLPLLLALAAGPPDPAPPPRLVGEPVVLATPTGTLHGTLDLPPGPGPWPAVVLHPGSGPTDRDGNQVGMRNNSLKQVGRALAAPGVAVLRVDKRGVGASRKALAREEDIRLDTYAADLAGWVRWLRADGRFTKVGLVGHSEGALIALLAAGEAKPDAVVSLCGPGRRLGDVLREQLEKAPRAQLPPDLHDASRMILSELETGATVKDPPVLLASLFRPSVQPYLISALRHDPAALAAAYPGPLLAVTGTTDIQVPTADGDRLAAARPGVRHVSVAGMNHVLKAVPTTDRAAQLRAYNDPSSPPHPELVGPVADFLRAALGAK
ncbi:MAG: alpha/beta hydrolase [Gemmataceae bacterium]|nr:alpha/beta hydrolase [Gemmataceae bacterium]